MIAFQPTLQFLQIWYWHQEVGSTDISALKTPLIQVPRIAKKRNISESAIKDLIQKTQETPFPWNRTTNCKCPETKYGT